jgi:hypothetical protein
MGGEGTGGKQRVRRDQKPPEKLSPVAEKKRGGEITIYSTSR